MRSLPVDLEELAIAMEDHSYAFDWYLDTKTGDTVMLPGESGDPGAWPDDELERLERILVEDPDRLQPVPRIPSHQGYDWMVSFTSSVQDDQLRELLWVALDGKGAFRRFKRVLAGYPEERERWFRFHGERVREELLDWLHFLEIDAGLAEDDAATE